MPDANGVPRWPRFKCLKWRAIPLAGISPERPLPCRRQYLPGIYGGLTIPGHLRGIAEPRAATGHKASAMRIFGSNAPALVPAASQGRRVSGGGFAVAEHDAPAANKPAAALRTIGGIDALMALQGQDGPTERRKRAVQRGRTALDALDEL